MLENFDEQAHRAVDLAAQEATQLGHGHIGTEHLLLGILAEGTSGASDALLACGATLNGCRAKVAEAVASKRDAPRTSDMQFTDRANRALDRAVRLSLRRRCASVEAEHVLVSVLEVEGTAGQVLRGLSVDPGRVRAVLSEEPHDLAAQEPRGGTDSEASRPPPCCGNCHSLLESALAHRALTSRGDDGSVHEFLVAYCSACGVAVGAIEA